MTRRKRNKKRTRGSVASEVLYQTANITGGGSYCCEFVAIRDLATFMSQLINKGQRLNIRKVVWRTSFVSTVPTIVKGFVLLYDSSASLTLPYESTSITDRDPISSLCDGSIEFDASEAIQSRNWAVDDVEKYQGTLVYQLTAVLQRYAQKYLGQADQGTPPGLMLAASIRQLASNVAVVYLNGTIEIEYTVSDAKPLSI
jgi:hypothetical protein